MSLTKKIVGNGIAVAFQKGVRIVEQLLLVPFFISAWGAAYYGEWLTLTIIPSVLALSDLGFGTAAANSFVLKYAAGEKDEAANIAKSGFSVITAVIGLGALLSVLLLIILAHFHVFDKSLIKQDDAIWAISILILARLIGFYTQLFEAYFRAARRAAFSINLITVNSLANIAAGILVLLSGWGIIAFAISQLIVAVAFNVVYSSIARSALGLFKEFKGRVHKSDIKLIAAKGFGYLMSPIWQAIYFQGTTFVIRITLGAEAVTIFNTVRTASRSINQLFNMIDATIFPEMLYEIGANNFEKVRKLFRFSIWISFSMALIGFVLLYFFGMWFYGVWTHNTLHVPDSMWNIFILGILLNALWWTGGVVFRAVNKPFRFTTVGLIAAVISVISSYFLSKAYGLTGAAMGSFVLDLIMVGYVLPVSCQLLGMSVKDMGSHLKPDILELVGMIGKKIRY